MPASCRIFSLADYTRGTSFVATPIDLVAKMELLNALESMDYIIFAYEFDLSARRCCGGFLYKERDQAGQDVSEHC